MSHGSHGASHQNAYSSAVVVIIISLQQGEGNRDARAAHVGLSEAPHGAIVVEPDQRTGLTNLNDLAPNTSQVLRPDAKAELDAVASLELTSRVTLAGLNGSLDGADPLDVQRAVHDG